MLELYERMRGSPLSQNPLHSFTVLRQSNQSKGFGDFPLVMKHSPGGQIKLWATLTVQTYSVFDNYAVEEIDNVNIFGNMVFFTTGNCLT